MGGLRKPMLEGGYGPLLRFHCHYCRKWREGAFLGGAMVEREKTEGYRPAIVATSKRKKWVVWDALRDNAFVRKIHPSIILSINHIVEFVDLWVVWSNFSFYRTLLTTYLGNLRGMVSIRQHLLIGSNSWAA